MGKEYKLKNLYSNMALLLTAFILGLSFVAQKAGMEYIGPFTFNTIRNFLGGLSLLPIIFIAKIYSAKKYPLPDEKIKERYKLLLKGGIICGILFFLALSVHQYCMIYAPAGKAGFITAMYIIFVLGVILWTAYGLILHDITIILSNGITTLLAGIILYYKYKESYSSKK